MSSDDVPWADADTIAGALSLLSERDDRARLISPIDGSWVTAERGRSHWTAAGSYTAALREDQILRARAGHAGAIAYAEFADEVVAVQEVFSVMGVNLRRITQDEVTPALSPGDRARQRLEMVIGELQLPMFLPGVYPLQLSDLADALDYQDLSDSIVERTQISAIRQRSSFPLHEFEAFSGAGPLAEADALSASRSVRDDLETCDVIIAERWAHSVLIDLVDEVAFSVDGLPIGGMAFSPDAHMLGDWLQLSVAELAAGAGHLVILGRRFAEDRNLIDLDDGEMAPLHPITADPWHLWVFHAGAVIRFRLRSRGRDQPA